MDKRMAVQLNAGRKINGVLRGYDPFMNLVFADALEEIGEKRVPIGQIVVRGNAVESMEALERV